MSSVLSPSPMPSAAPRHHAQLHQWRAPSSAEGRGVGSAPSSAGFVAMLAAYRATGGTARADDLARLLQDRQHGGYVSLARLLATRQVFSFEWRDSHWVPMFQFDLNDLSIRPGPQQVLAELSTEFDDWSLAVWFTQPNSWLNHRKPVDLLGTDLKNVIDAARADRFIAAG
jgi:hypothetical protein